MNFFRTIVSLCLGFQSYRPVRDLPVTASLRYLVQLVVLLVVILLASFVPWGLHRCEDLAGWMDKHLPPFSIQDGQVVTTAKQPFRTGTDDFLFVLDTTGAVTAPDPSVAQGILVMRDRFLFWFKPPNTPPEYLRSQVQPLRGFPDGPINGDYFRSNLRPVLWVGLPFIAVGLVVAGLLLTLVQACFFSWIGSIMERSAPHPLRFQQLLNIALHAVTPAAIIVTAYLAMRLTDIDLWLIYLVAYGIFLVGATYACRQHDPSTEPQEGDPL